MSKELELQPLAKPDEPSLAEQIGSIEAKQNKLATKVSELDKNLQLVVTHVNKWIQKIEGIDSVAFAALYLHVEKEIKLTEDGVKENQEAIQAILKEFADYRKKMNAKNQKKTKAKKSGKSSKNK